MGWWENFSSAKNIIGDYIWYIEQELESWVKSWAEYAASNADRYFSILSYTWSDVKDYAVSAAASAYDLLDDKIDDARDYAKDKANEAYNNAVSQIGDLESYARNKANEAYNNAVSKVNDVAGDLSSFRSTVNTGISGLDSRIDSLTNVVGNIDIPGTATIRSWLATDFSDIRKGAKEYTDGAKQDLLIALQSADKIAGAARAKMIKDLEAVVKRVETDSLTARASIKKVLETSISALENSSKTARAILEKALKNAITEVETSSKTARDVLEKTLENSLERLERDAKQAREVMEGTLIQIIEGIEDALEKAITDLERSFKGLLDTVINRVSVLEGWVDNFATAFDTEINKYQNRVVTWIVEGFEGILDRVFK